MPKYRLVRNNKASSSAWSIDFHYEDADGQRRRARRSTGEADREAAERVAPDVYLDAIQEIRHEIALAKRAPDRADEAWSLKDAVDIYVGEVVVDKKDRQEEHQLERVCEILGGDTPVGDIEVRHLEQIKRHLRGTLTQLNKPHGPISINRHIKALRSCLAHLARSYSVPQNPKLDFRGIYEKEPEERVRYIPQDSLPEFFRTVAKKRPDFLDWVLFSLVSGARKQNVFGLEWRDIRWGEGVIVLRDVKSGVRGHTKTHTIPLNDDLRAILDEQRGRHPRFVFTFIAQRSLPKLGYEKGQRYPLTKEAVRRPWQEIMKAAGMDDFHVHDMRHHAATTLLRACGDLTIVQKLLGHTNIETTQRYAHTLQDDVLNAMNRASGVSHFVSHYKSNNEKGAQD